MRLGSVLTGATMARALGKGGRLSLLIFGLAVLAMAGGQPVQAGPIGPQLPKAIKGEKCVTPTPDIRRNHMRYLDHHRDKTVHEGIRTKKFSLKGCIECHALKDENGNFLTVKDPRHFCRVCHDYAAVKLDCFDCHASRPDVKKKQALIVPKDRVEDRSEMAALQRYLAGKMHVKGGTQ